jgi:hypothetical protein
VTVSCEGVAGMRSCEGAASQLGQEPLNTKAKESALLEAAVRQRSAKTN